MRPAGWLTALAVCLVAVPVVPPAPVLAAAKPAPGLCSMNTSRGTIPASFAIDACVTNSGIWLRNQLQVPVRFKVSGDAGKPVNVHTDISPESRMSRGRSAGQPWLLASGPRRSSAWSSMPRHTWTS